MPDTTAHEPLDGAAEFDRQVRTLVDLGYPAMAGLDAGRFEEMLAPLRVRAGSCPGESSPVSPAESGRVPFLLVVAREIAPIEQTMPRTTLAGGTRPGFVDRSFEPGALERFVPVPPVRLPSHHAYLLSDVERGEEFCGVVPDEAVETLIDRGRTPLTIEEGIALLTHHREVLVKNKCFSLGGSRSGDRRVPALWISRRAPKLGWCWAGNPHTWLGMASAGSRLAAA